MSETGSKTLKSILFALALGVLSSLFILIASVSLRPLQEENLLTDKKKNILKAAGLLSETRSYSRDEIGAIYDGNIRTCYVDGTGHLFSEPASGKTRLKIYFQVKDDEVVSYIIPIDTKGLWGRILGYLALERDGSTISGFTVYSHSETPGLGGEIERSWFQKSFVGKKIINQAHRFVSVKIAKGKAPSDQEDHYVDGISGATLTGQYLSSGLQEILRRYEPVSVKFRSGEIGKIHPQNKEEEHGEEPL